MGSELVVEFQNVCGARSDFILLGVEPKKGALLEKLDLPEGLTEARVVPESEWHELIRIHQPGVEPGETHRKSIELGDQIELDHVRWGAPNNYKNRFLVKELTWRGKSLLRKPGLI